LPELPDERMEIRKVMRPRTVARVPPAARLSEG
jgi:hypothetical protein